MRASAKTEYACLALVKLAERYSTGDPVRIREIADDHGIPSRFLVQILLQLKGAGFVQSTRGATGGYQLSRAPEEISLADVVGIIEGPENQPTAASAIDTPSARALLGVWREVTDVEQQMLASISLADLAERARGEADSMYYI